MYFVSWHKGTDNHHTHIPTYVNPTALQWRDLSTLSPHKSVGFCVWRLSSQSVSLLLLLLEETGCLPAVSWHQLTWTPDYLSNLLKRDPFLSMQTSFLLGFVSHCTMLSLLWTSVLFVGRTIGSLLIWICRFFFFRDTWTLFNFYSSQKMEKIFILKIILVSSEVWIFLFASPPDLISFIDWCEAFNPANTKINVSSESVSPVSHPPGEHQVFWARHFVNL